MPKLQDPETCIDDDPAPTTAMLCAADYPAQGVEWLWPGRIPIGKVTLMVGDPGNGKSLVALDVAARISRGRVWPEESCAGTADVFTTPQFPHSPGSVLILSAEDDLRDTIRPRLDAAKADPNKVFVLPSIVDLRHDLPELRTALAAIPDCRLIIIDSINAYVGPGDSHFHTIVRRVFQPLAQLAAEHNLAVLAISHLRKTEGAAIQRAAGSMGYVAASRAVWTVCRDHSQPGRHLLLPIKNNFVAEATGLAFQIEMPSIVPLNSNGTAPMIAWDPNPVTTKSDEALNQEKPRSEKPPSEDDSEVHMAAAWLRQALANGPVDAFYILNDGMLGGFNERTLRRALIAIGGATQKESFRGGWVWALPDHNPPHSEGVSQSESVKCRDDERHPPKSLSPSQDAVPFREKPTSACPLRAIPEDFEEGLEDFEQRLEKLRSRDPFLRPNQLVSEEVSSEADAITPLFSEHSIKTPVASAIGSPPRPP